MNGLDEKLKAIEGILDDLRGFTYEDSERRRGKPIFEATEAYDTPEHEAAETPEEEIAEHKCPVCGR